MPAYRNAPQWARANIKKQRKIREDKQRDNEKPYKCIWCSYRTGDESKAHNHWEKYEKTYIHGIPNPHIIGKIENDHIYGVEE